MTKSTAVAAILSAALAAAATLVVAGVRFGSLAERMDQVEEMATGEAERVSQAFDAFASAPRAPGPEIRFSNSGPWGAWSDPVYCPVGHYVCGLRQRVEGNQGSDGDDSAMNAVSFYCCPLNPSAHQRAP